MDNITVRNIYEINGYIDQNYMFICSDTLRSYIAEVQETGKPGYTYYAFLTLKKNPAVKDGYTPQTTFMRLTSLDELVNSPKVKVLRRTNPERLTTYFMKLLETQKDLNGITAEEIQIKKLTQ